MNIQDFINQWYIECGPDDEWSRRVVPLGHRLFGFNSKKLYKLLNHEYRFQLRRAKLIEEIDQSRF